MTTVNYGAVPITGVLCGHGALVLGWPLETEFDAITAVRNSTAARQWFLDDQPLDVAANRLWLAEGIQRPAEALLSIRRSGDGLFLGTIGWSQWFPERATADFGRLALDRGALALSISSATQRLKSIALDATTALRDFAFEVMQLEYVTTSYITGNVLAARLNARVGMVVDRCITVRRPDGRKVEMVELSLNRRRWLALRSS